jgi:hypothetical protein
MISRGGKANVRVQSQSEVRALLSSILPKGKGIVLMLKFYGDESMDEQGKVMNVSGFIMEESGFAFLDEAVQVVRGDLPYFHMCEGHHLSHPEVYARMCKLICRDFIKVGISASLPLNEHKAITDHQLDGQSLRYWTGTTYTYLLSLTMAVCNEWLNKTEPSSGYIAYVFEGGHQNAGDASYFFNQLQKWPLKTTRNSYRYASHTFIDGKGPLGSVLQLADIFAWHMNKEATGESSLEDVGKMFRIPIYTKEHGEQEIIESMISAKRQWIAHRTKTRR